LSAKGIRWTWYAGAWQAALDDQNSVPTPNFQYHHQPFNYFATNGPGTAARASTSRMRAYGVLNSSRRSMKAPYRQSCSTSLREILNQHPGYADAWAGDHHLAQVIAHLEKSPQWDHMLVIVTYDENGGFWDHVAPPKADRWGPGNRIPALIISPFTAEGLHRSYAL